MDTREFFNLCLDFKFCPEACKQLAECYKKIRNDKNLYEHLYNTAEKYKKGVDFSFYEEQIKFEKSCSSVSVHPYPAQMIFYLYLSPILKEFYKEKGLGDEMFEGVKEGIKCKLDECYSVYGIYGSFVAIWFSRFFTFTLFPIGRLEFAPYLSDFEYKNGGFDISKGDALIDVHIPSKGRLEHDEVITAYLKAYEFFTNYYKREFKAFICDSWLLYPENYNIIPNCKNIIAFMDDYHIFKWHQDPSNDDLWRIFGSSALNYPDSPLDDKTYMQKQFIKHFQNGGSLGIGFGLHMIPKGVDN